MPTPVRIATFNVENLFRRASALNQPTWAKSKPILEDYSKFCSTIAKDNYSAADKTWMEKFLAKYNLHLRDAKKAKFFQLNEVREKLFKVPKGTKTPEIIVDGRDDWDGWVEFKKDDIVSDAIENTARVIKAVNADVLAVVEAEDRIALKLFNDQILDRHGATYPYNMLIDGNDDRGIDVGVYSRYPITHVRSNIDAGLPGPRIFSRDCAEFEITVPGGESLWLLVNHLKSKGYGAADTSNARRKAQAAEIARIYQERHAGHAHVIVAGDFNDTPDSDPLSPLLGGTNLKDAMQHPSYATRANALPGTFGSGSKGNKLDYLLLSPDLWGKVKSVDVERRGVWAPRTFPHFPEVTSAKLAASDHAAVWVEVEL